MFPRTSFHYCSDMGAKPNPPSTDASTAAVSLVENVPVGESEHARDAGLVRDIVVMGASAGGVEALKAVLGALPADYSGSVCVVLHIPPSVPSVLAHILGRSTQLVCISAYDGAPVRPGVVYVAPPDAHLLLQDGRVRLLRGPRENGHRPGIDPLFRSAAEAYGPRVVGVVLTGNLDDGTRGLLAIKRRGGLAVVQSPEDAPYPSMPQSAVEHVAVDHVVPASVIGSLLAAVARGDAVPVSAGPADGATREPQTAQASPAPAPMIAAGVYDALEEIATMRLTKPLLPEPGASEPEADDEGSAQEVPSHERPSHELPSNGNGAPDAEVVIAVRPDVPGSVDFALHHVADLASGIGEVNGGAKINEALGGHLSGYTCPECRGALWELREGALVRYRCRVGHSYTEAGLVDNKARAVEDAIWTAVTALEESAAIAQRVSDRARRHGRSHVAETFRERAEHLEQRGAMLRDLLTDVPGHVDGI